MSESENLDISLVFERPLPKIHFLVLEKYQNEVMNEMTSLAQETKMREFISIKTSPSDKWKNPEQWIDFLLSIDWRRVFSIMGAVSSTIEVGTFLEKVLNSLRRRRVKGQIRRLRGDCTASVALAVQHLRKIYGGLPNQMKLVYLSEKLVFHCVAIFVSPFSNPKQLLVITTHIDGRLSDFVSTTL